MERSIDCLGGWIAAFAIMLIQHSECEYDGTSVKLPVHPASSGLQRRSREDSTP